MRNTEAIVIRIAQDSAEIAAAGRLKYQAYRRKGYVSPIPSRTMSDVWDDVPGSVHFVALHGSRIVGAVRLVPDSSKGLPMEQEFAQEIASLRREGRMVAEASGLVTADSFDRACHKVWLRLCRAVWQETLARGIHDLCVAITRSHLGFYRKLLFEPMGQPKPYRSLRGILAYPLRLQVAGAKAKDQPDGSLAIALRNDLRDGLDDRGRV